MANNVYFITTAEIKANTVIQTNIDDKYMKPAILVAQDLVLERLMGSDLFNEVVNQITGSTVSTANASLLNESKKCLIHWSVYHALDSMFMKITEIGIGQKNTDSFTSLDYTTFGKIKDDARNLAEEYSERFRKWLYENRETYPLYMTGNSDYDDIRPDNSSQYFSGMVFKKRPSRIPDCCKSENPPSNYSNKNTFLR